jgi:ribosomal protein L29
MKVTKIKEECTQADIGALSAKLNDLRRELFTLRLNAATAHVKDYSQYKKLRRDVARVLTYLRQKAV